MSDKAVSITVQGDKELIRKLRTLPVRVQKKVVRKALRDGAKIVAARVKTTVPVLTGILRSSIKVRAQKRSRKSIGVQVITSQGWYKGPAFYGAFVEFGHRMGPRKLGDKRPMIEGKHYFEKSATAVEPQVRSQVMQAIARGIEVEAKRG